MGFITASFNQIEWKRYCALINQIESITGQCTSYVHYVSRLEESFSDLKAYVWKACTSAEIYQNGLIWSVIPIEAYLLPVFLFVDIKVLNYSFFLISVIDFSSQIYNYYQKKGSFSDCFYSLISCMQTSISLCSNSVNDIRLQRTNRILCCLRDFLKLQKLYQTQQHSFNLKTLAHTIQSIDSLFKALKIVINR